MTDETTYGERFLDAWKRYSGTLGQFDYATIQTLKAADREQFIKALRGRKSMLPYATIRLLREGEPEEAARVMHTQAAQAAQGGLLTDASLWILLAMS